MVYVCHVCVWVCLLFHRTCCWEQRIAEVKRQLSSMPLFCCHYRRHNHHCRCCYCRCCRCRCRWWHFKVVIKICACFTSVIRLNWPIIITHPDPDSNRTLESTRWLIQIHLFFFPTRSHTECLPSLCGSLFDSFNFSWCTRFWYQIFFVHLGPLQNAVRLNTHRERERGRENTHT